MLIPYQDLDNATLTNLIEYFILREGTDYGDQEICMRDKRDQVLEQIKQGSVVIIYSELNESVTLISKAEFNKQQA